MTSTLRQFSVSSVLLTVALLPLAGQSAGEPKRIQLNRGSAPVTLDGQVVKAKDVTYVFSAKAGVKFNGRITRKAGNVGFAVSDPEGNGLPEEEFDFNTTLTGTIEKTGDYKIVVSTFESKPTQYTLVVRVY